MVHAKSLIYLISSISISLLFKIQNSVTVY